MCDADTDTMYPGGEPRKDVGHGELTWTDRAEDARLQVYIDGFSFSYAAFRRGRFADHKWLDLVRFCQRALPRNHIDLVLFGHDVVDGLSVALFLRRLTDLMGGAFGL